MIDTNIFRKISYGLYVIGSTREGAFNGQIANTVFQISSEPATVAVSINKNNMTCEFIKASGVFSVSVLPATAGLDFIGRFGFKSGRDTDKYKGISYRVGITGSPLLLEQSLGFIEAEVIGSLEVETHIVFIGKVVNTEVFTGNAEPMTYAYYHQVKKGLVPPAAPTYIKEGEKAENKAGEKEREDSLKNNSA